MLNLAIIFAPVVLIVILSSAIPNQNLTKLIVYPRRLWFSKIDCDIVFFKCIDLTFFSAWEWAWFAEIGFISIIMSLVYTVSVILGAIEKICLGYFDFDLWKTLFHKCTFYFLGRLKTARSKHPVPGMSIWGFMLKILNLQFLIHLISPFL